ncbi:hypothetical protein FGG08_000296 [Glutinoglossum americanum]|uniref:RING-type E3 ubiquitin transferase n=1 Tax=Glutinoglossum americanum TaxID=1670608 RepID=A0A9P8IGP8_9PEZI|nr:hypothetical protein FGG08_000296 [Glutinoglossum americanum]
MDSPRLVLLVFLLLFLFLSPDSQQPSQSQQNELDDLIAEEHNALEVLRSSRYGDLDVYQGTWLNITGFRDVDGLAWDVLPDVKHQAQEQLKYFLGEEGQRKLYGLDVPVTADASVDGGKAQDRLQLDNGQISLYRNVTGIVRGNWRRSPPFRSIRPPRINLTSLTPQVALTSQDYDRNVTGSGGKIQIRLDEKTGEELVVSDDVVREISGTMTLRDESSPGDGWDINLHGVHFQSFGGLILTTTSEKFAGLFALPHFSLSPHTYSLVQGLLNKTLSSAILAQESSMSKSPIYPWASSSNHPSDILFPTPRCEYVVYLQQDPVEFKIGRVSSATLKLLEDELRFPTGAPVPNAPDMVMSMTLFSPDCGFVLESVGPPESTTHSANHLRGPKIESFLWLVKRVSALFAIISGLQIVLLIRQMNEAATPSTVSRISFYTIAIMAMGDGFMLMGFLTAGIYIDAAFLMLFSTAFIAFLSVCVFGMRFLIAIWRVQAPERRERERSGSPTNGTPSQTRQTPATVTPAGTETLPLPVTTRAANRTAPVIILPPDQDLSAAETEDNTITQNTNQVVTTDSRSAISTLYSRFYFILLGLIFLSLHATSWPQRLRSVYANIMVFTYLSFWTPQIYRNVMRNCRKALRWDFVVGQSILRLVPIVYVYSVPSNIVYVETDTRAAFAPVAWVWIQICALASQEVLGPRFVVPNGWAPPAYDYHPILREDDLESGAMPTGSAQVAEEEDVGKPDSAAVNAKGTPPRAKWKRTWDCAICMQDVEVHIVPSESSGGNETAGSTSTGLGSGILGRRSYMVTPCRHIFHTASTIPTLPAESRAAILDVLFEPSEPLRALSAGLLAGNSFASYDALVAAVGRQLEVLLESSSAGDAEWLDGILTAHPRLGEKKVDSALSRGEQAGLNQGGSQEGERLRALNEDYEKVFPGLRYVCVPLQHCNELLFVLPSADIRLLKRLGQWKEPADNHGGHASTHQTRRYQVGKDGGS